jgi:hypothetical protein
VPLPFWRETWSHRCWWNGPASRRPQQHKLLNVSGADLLGGEVDLLGGGREEEVALMGHVLGGEDLPLNSIGLSADRRGVGAWLDGDVVSSVKEKVVPGVTTKGRVAENSKSRSSRRRVCLNNHPNHRQPPRHQNAATGFCVRAAATWRRAGQNEHRHH